MANTAKRRPPNAGKGRPKGSLNKTTKSVKEALTAAFEELGGVRSLVVWGKEQPGDFYKLWGRLVPTEITGKDGGAIQHEHRQQIVIGGRTIVF